MNPVAGVYKIIDGKDRVYIGSSVNMKNRISNHKRDLRNNRHSNKKLQRSWNKYGEEFFYFEELETCSKADLIAREQYWLDTSQPYYNILRTAYSVLGLRHSEEFKQARRKFRHSDETKISMSKTRLGRKFSEEHRENISKALTGNVVSGATRLKLSVVGKAKGIPSEMQEAANKVNRSRQRTDNELNALRAANASRKGKPMPEAHRQALVEAWKRRKAKLLE